jgi:hypothetical protein
MKPFHTIAVPHKDILQGKLTMEVFAADLWDTYQGRAPEEYKDATRFFEKTQLTRGLSTLLDVVERRLQGKGGDPVIQIQTPWGGGKTHALIAMYHKAREWKAKTVVIVGTPMGKNDTIWGAIEKQLTGSVRKLSGEVSPGREALRSVLEKHQPLLILMDEVLEYAIKAAGVKVADSTLAAQCIAFMQELTELAGTLERVCVVVTLPSSSHQDERLFQQLQSVTGRVEKVYTPVEEPEITGVIRKRLFSKIDGNESKSVVTEFLEYADKEDILPVGKEVSVYRDRFLDSYPFLPEVVDVLYQRWGSFPTFQRTRGVLRLLSLVIYALKESARPYITLADFDLANEQLRRELIKHIGSEYDSVIAADITGIGAGAKTVDKSLGKSFQGLALGSRSTRTIFLYSFSGGQERGAHMGEIKRSATTLENPSSVVAEAVEQLKTKLFFLQSSDGKYYFSDQANLNRIVVTKIENIKPGLLTDTEKQLLKSQLRRQDAKLKVFPWPEKPKDVPDTEELKLVIASSKNEVTMRNLLEAKGEGTPRTNVNTIFFLCPAESERALFSDTLKRKIAYEEIQSDKTVNLTPEQIKEVSKHLEKETENMQDAVRRLYRLIYVPVKSGFKEIDMGIPTYGERKMLDDEVYDKLRQEGEILEKIAPLVITEKYLKDKEYVKLNQIYDAMLRTPGERRVQNASVIEEGIKQGVRQGFFGLGEAKKDGKVVCRYFKEDANISATDTEVLMTETSCLAQRQPSSTVIETPTLGTGGLRGSLGTVETPPDTEVLGKVMHELSLKFPIPRGKIAQIMGVMNFLQSKFQSLEIEIKAKGGSISESEYADKIKEAMKQLGIDLDNI